MADTNGTATEIPAARVVPPDSQATRDDVQRWLEVLCPEVRNRRRPIENTWLLNHGAWRAVKTRFFFTEGVSDHYIPAMRRAIERFVTRARQLVLPAPEFFEVYPGSDQDAQTNLEAENARAYLLHVLTKRVKIKPFVDQLFRCLQLYGRAITKTTIEVIDQPVLRMPANGDKGPVTTEVVKQVWPTSRPVDPFMFYVWPETVTNLKDAVVLFEDVMVPYEQYASMADQKNLRIDTIDRDDLTKPEWPLYHTTRLSQSGLVEPSATGGTSGASKAPTQQFVALTEAWFQTSDNTHRLAWIVWNLRGGPKLTRNDAAPYPESPYRMALARPVPGEHYTSGMADDLEPLQVWLNDQINMTGDALMTSMCPIAMVNPNAIFEKDSLVYRPRAKWLIDPQGVTFATPPDVTGVGWTGVQAILGFVDSFSGSNPLAEGTPTRGMPRAGFAISTLIQLSMSDIKGAAELVEDELLTPLLGDLYRLAVLFTPAQQRLALPPVIGLPARHIGINELYGDWTFKWVGSLQSQDTMVRAQRLLTFAGVLAKVGPLIQQAGFKIDWGTLFQRLWRESLGERGSGTILQKMTAQDAMLAMMMQAGPGLMQGAAGGPQGAAPGPPGGGAPGVGAPAPASAEAAGRQVARGQSEAAPNPTLQGLGVG